LIIDHLLPLARQGLANAEVDTADIDLYLGVIEERVRCGQTGAQWVLQSMAAMGDLGPKDARHRILTATMLKRQKEELPVHRWPLIKVSESDDWSMSYQTVGQFMSTDLFTVRPDDLVDLAASVMDWRHIRHVPVEDGEGRLVGLVTHRGLLHLFSRGSQMSGNLTVKDIMKAHPLTVTPTTPTLDAIAIMREQRVGCLPVVEGDQLVGIVTSYDFLEASARLFKQHLTVQKPSSKTAGTSN
jgi:CBS domain-containing protein